jgi:hypothetical protein
MTKHFAPVLGLIALAGCSPPGGGGNPFAWSASYAQPFEAMTYCLSARSTDYVAITGIDGRAGIGSVQLSSRRDNSPVGEFIVRRLDANSSEVTFKSRIQTLGGGSYLDRAARESADGCASPTG